jgi:hypothetical protein
MSRAAKILPVLLCLAVLTDVSAQEANASRPNSVVHELRLHPQFRTRDGNEFRHKLLPSELTYMFWMKPGHLYPKWRQNSFELQRVRGSRDSFVVNADDWTQRLDDVARPMNEWFTRKGFSIEPAETRIAVIHMSVYGTQTQRYIGDHSALVDSLREIQMLYVDRPCRIVGTEREEDGSLSFDADFVSPGFHLLATGGASRDRQVVPINAASELDLLTLF